MLITTGSTPKLLMMFVTAADPTAPLTGVTPTVALSKNGGAFASATNAPVEVDYGVYAVTLTATETNTAGPLAVRATATGAYMAWYEFHQVATSWPAALVDGEVVTLDQPELERIAAYVWRATTEALEDYTDDDIAALTGLSPLGMLAQFLHGIASNGSAITVKDSAGAALYTRTINTVNADGEPVDIGKAVDA